MFRRYLLRYASESVQVQLLQEGIHPSGRKILWHDISSELFRLVNSKGSSMRKEGNDMILAIGFGFVKDSVELDGKGFSGNRIRPVRIWLSQVWLEVLVIIQLVILVFFHHHIRLLLVV